MRSYIFVALLVSVALPCHAEWRERRAALPEMHQIAEFRIFYALSGPDALPSSEDFNRNGAPDYVDRIATNLVAALEMYQREMRLTHPLLSPRYKNLPEFIDVNLLKVPLTSNGPKHGIAYDELSSFDRPRDAGRKVRVLVMDISNDLPPGNPTPAHELFHVFQNGYTFFKNRWFTEGTARWVENLEKQDVNRVGPLPRSLSEVRELFQKTYETAPFWRSVGYRVDAANGGRAFLHALLDELGRMDDVARVDNGRGVGQWNEKDQMSSGNDVYIWKALQAALERPMFQKQWDDDIRRLMEMRL